MQGSNFRSSCSNGVWCCLLIPLSLWSSFSLDVHNNNNSDLKNVTFALSCLMCLLSLHLAYQLIYLPQSEGKGAMLHLAQLVVSDLFERTSSREARMLKKKRKTSTITTAAPTIKSNSNNIVTAATFLLVLFLLLNGTRLSYIAFAAASLCLFPKLLSEVFILFPGSFSFGEACVVTQAFTLFVFEGTLSLAYCLDNPDSVDGSFAIIGKSGLLSCLLLCVSPLIPGMKWTGKCSTFITLGIVVLFGATYPFLWVTLKRDPTMWVLELISSSRIRTGLMVSWAACSVLAVLTVRIQNHRASTRTRKIFHFIMVAAYTAGIVLDPALTYLASIVALCVFLLLESFRVHEIEPFSSFLTDSFDLFLDEKDQGKLILTHVYLLVGCSSPLWMCQDLQTASTVKLLSGVLAIGVGDSAASVVGSKFGRIRFPDSQKSVEGTAAAILSQVCFLALLERWTSLAVQDWVRLCLPIVIVSLAEALTNQVDNLVLPLMLYSLL